jgi:hypothetical protein
MCVRTWQGTRRGAAKNPPKNVHRPWRSVSALSDGRSKVYPFATGLLASAHHSLQEPA